MPKYRPNKCRDEQSRVRTDFGTNKPEQRLLKMDNESKPTNTVVAGEASESDDDDSEMNKVFICRNLYGVLNTRKKINKN